MYATTHVRYVTLRSQENFLNGGFDEFDSKYPERCVHFVVI
jgi:hypothetical protein